MVVELIGYAIENFDPRVLFKSDVVCDCLWRRTPHELVVWLSPLSQQSLMSVSQYEESWRGGMGEEWLYLPFIVEKPKYRNFIFLLLMFTNSRNSHECFGRTDEGI